MRLYNGRVGGMKYAVSVGLYIMYNNIIYNVYYTVDRTECIHCPSVLSPRVVPKNKISCRSIVYDYTYVYCHANFSRI